MIMKPPCASHKTSMMLLDASISFSQLSMQCRYNAGKKLYPSWNNIALVLCSLWKKNSIYRARETRAFIFAIARSSGLAARSFGELPQLALVWYAVTLPAVYTHNV